MFHSSKSRCAHLHLANLAAPLRLVQKTTWRPPTIICGNRWSAEETDNAIEASADHRASARMQIDSRHCIAVAVTSAEHTPSAHIVYAYGAILRGHAEVAKAWAQAALQALARVRMRTFEATAILH